MAKKFLKIKNQFSFEVVVKKIILKCTLAEDLQILSSLYSIWKNRAKAPVNLVSKCLTSSSTVEYLIKVCSMVVMETGK